MHYWSETKSCVPNYPEKTQSRSRIHTIVFITVCLGVCVLNLGLPLECISYCTPTGGSSSPWGLCLHDLHTWPPKKTQSFSARGTTRLRFGCLNMFHFYLVGKTETVLVTLMNICYIWKCFLFCFLFYNAIMGLLYDVIEKRPRVLAFNANKFHNLFCLLYCKSYCAHWIMKAWSKGERVNILVSSVFFVLFFNRVGSGARPRWSSSIWHLTAEKNDTKENSSLYSKVTITDSCSFVCLIYFLLRRVPEWDLF